MLNIIRIALCSFLIFSFINNASSFTIIRDFETEELFYKISRPLLDASNLDAKNIKIYIINDKSINAFVSNGQNIFINTGLITKYTDPNILIGVIAHEIGHIASGHLARSSEEMQKVRNTILLSYLGGIISTLAGGVDGGYAMIMGGNQIAERLFLKYNRYQEEAADMLALKYLNKTSNSPKGLLKLLKFFKMQMIAYDKIIDEYALSHPISQKRISFIEENSKNLHKNYQNSKINENSMKRVVAKIKGFLDDPEQSLIITKNKEDFFSKYQRIIALYKAKKTEDSIKLLNKLLINNPLDPYLWELKGQILYENGSLKESIIAYKKSIDLKKDNHLAKISLAKAIIDLESNEVELINFAINNLKAALMSEDSIIQINQILSNAFNQIGDKGNSNLYLAEFYFAQNNFDEAIKYAKKSKEFFKDSNKSKILKINDIIKFATDMKKIH